MRGLTGERTTGTAAARAWGWLQVDLTLYGHYHSYQRTCPVYQNKCVDDGLVHITVGSAGAWLDLVGFYDVRHPRA
jgi:hypothetical protein